MKTLAIAILLVCGTAYAGQDEYNRDLEHAKIDHKYAIKSCKTQKTEPVTDCIKRHEDYLKDKQNDLKTRHLGAQK